MDGCVMRAFWHALPSLFEATELMKFEPESLGMELTSHEVTDRIVTLRGLQVLLDRHLAEMYQVETKALNRAVKRNQDRFPEAFCFQLNGEEWDRLKCQMGASNLADPLRFQSGTLKSPTRGQHRKYLPYVFTEQGVAMLSAVLHSETAVKVSIRIIDAFVEMRRFLLNNAPLIQRMEQVELRQLRHIADTDEKFNQAFNALKGLSDEVPRQGVFYNGQIFDAYAFVASLIKQAKSSLVLVDNYVDESVLLMLSKRGPEVSAAIYTQKVGKRLELDLQKHAAQYAAIEVQCADRCHDRFLIIDGRELYHIGASLKDLGKSCFAFSRMDGLASEILQRLGRG
jgi:phage regulator Rha-like protein